jgi:hypothetical protein
MPRPAAAIRTILRLLDAAHAALSEPTADQDPVATAAGIALALVDGARRALAELGAQR